MSESHERDEVWQIVRELHELEPIGDHIDPVHLRDYVRGLVEDAARIREIGRHLFSCEACLTAELRLESHPAELWDAITLPLRALRQIGSMWIAQPVGIEAAVPSAGEKRAEDTTSGELKLEARVTPSEMLNVTVSRAGEPCAGWLVRLERLGHAAPREETSATTDADGRANLGPAQREAIAGESFQIVAEPPVAD